MPHHLVDMHDLVKPARRRGEEGWALVSALVLTSIMLTIGLAAFAFVDTETRASGQEREREARLNLTEGTLGAEIFLMSRDWPDSATSAYPVDCTETSTDPRCPQPAQLRSHFKGIDFTRGSHWSIKVRDNAGTSGKYYSDSAILGQATWDQGGPAGATTPDGEMWVRAEGRLGTKKRIVVARVRVERKPLQFPDGPFVAGSFGTGNSGNKTIVSTGGKNGIVRCTSALGPSHKDNPCMSYDTGQVQPVGTVISDPSTPTNLIPPGLLDSLRAMAKSKGTYHDTDCPSNPSGEVVFVENGDLCPLYNGNMTVNTAANPGLFIINRGAIKINGGTTWYGVIYGVNTQNTSGTVVELSGNSDIRGGVFVDGPGRLSVGNSKNNLTYDPSVTQTRTAYGTAGIIQNTWRELTRG